MTSTFMALALAEAERARGRTAPRPPVGAVLARDGVVVGRGHTQPPGGVHAEVMALRDAGALARGATCYVTLEPCCHFGRTPPCTNALIDAGVTSVVAAIVDPNPLVAGGGLTQLRAAGLRVDVGDGAAESQAMLRPFFKHIGTGQPFVTAKWAMTLDGKIATATGDARWVSGASARQWAHELRDVVDAVVVGIGTVLADDPALTVRLPVEAQTRSARLNAPLRVVLDSRCRIPLQAKLLSPDLAGGTLVYATPMADPAGCAAISSAGAEVRIAPADSKGQVDVTAVVNDLGRRGLLHVLVEGGAAIHASLLTSCLVDEVAVVIAPKMVGGATAPSPVTGGGIARMADALLLRDRHVATLGDDLLIRGLVESGESGE